VARLSFVSKQLQGEVDPSGLGGDDGEGEELDEHLWGFKGEIGRLGDFLRVGLAVCMAHVRLGTDFEGVFAGLLSNNGDGRGRPSLHCSI
jgi:hypothetical protein